MFTFVVRDKSITDYRVSSNFKAADLMSQIDWNESKNTWLDCLLIIVYELIILRKTVFVQRCIETFDRSFYAAALSSTPIPRIAHILVSWKNWATQKSS